MKKILGILGGMGPQATIDLFQRIVDLTKAETDQQHLRIVVDNYPQIPDRIAAVLAGGEDPLPALLEAAQNLERCGAGCIVIPCVTAHFFLPRLAELISVPILNMPELVAQACGRQFPNAVAGLLCSAATAKSGLFGQALERQGVAFLLPEEQEQQEISRLILAVKAKGDPEALWQRLLPIIRSLRERGADYLALACTELPVIARGHEEIPLIDATGELARAAIRFCGYETVD